MQEGCELVLAIVHLWISVLADDVRFVLSVTRQRWHQLLSSCAACFRSANLDWAYVQHTKGLWQFDSAAHRPVLVPQMWTIAQSRVNFAQSKIYGHAEFYEKTKCAGCRGCCLLCLPVVLPYLYGWPFGPAVWHSVIITRWSHVTLYNNWHANNASWSTLLTKHTNCK